MLLTSVILILQETLEAALLIGILAVVTLQAGRRLNWLPWGLLAGAALALVYAANIRSVSEWFDYVGQEIVNAALQTAIAAVIVMLAWLTGRTRDAAADPGAPRGEAGALFGVLCALAVTLAATREGSEIWVYLSGFFGQQDKVQAVLVGSAIGFGIGLSAGFLLFYGLMVLRRGWGRWAPLVLLALFSGNMLAQSSLQLAQADWLQAGATLWDTSSWLPEDSIAGRLLYALVGYESRPSVAQVLAYLAGLVGVLLAFAAGRRIRVKGVAPLLALLVSFGPACAPARADGLVVDKIYHPYVQPLEREIETRAILQNRQPGRPDNLQVYKLAYGMSLGEKWFAELYLTGWNSDAGSFELEAYEVEALRQLTEQGEFWADWGVVFELEKERGTDAWEILTGLLAEKEWGRWSGTANLFLLHEWGSDIVDETETRLGLQARYRHSPAFEPAIEVYSGEDTRGIGPAVLGQVRLGGGRKLGWEAGAIFGLDSKSPDTTLRFLLEFEF